MKFSIISELQEEQTGGQSPCGISSCTLCKKVISTASSRNDRTLCESCTEMITDPYSVMGKAIRSAVKALLIVKHNKR